MADLNAILFASETKQDYVPGENVWVVCPGESSFQLFQLVWWEGGSVAALFPPDGGGVEVVGAAGSTLTLVVRAAGNVSTGAATLDIYHGVVTNLELGGAVTGKIITMWICLGSVQENSLSSYSSWYDKTVVSIVKFGQLS